MGRRAAATGLRCRPLSDTVADTWDWLVTTGKALPANADRPRLGLDPAKERAALAAWRSRAR